MGGARLRHIQAATPCPTTLLHNAVSHASQSHHGFPVSGTDGGEATTFVCSRASKGEHRLQEPLGECVSFSLQGTFDFWGSLVYFFLLCSWWCPFVSPFSRRTSLGTRIGMGAAKRPVFLWISTLYMSPFELGSSLWESVHPCQDDGRAITSLCVKRQRICSLK